MIPTVFQVALGGAIGAAARYGVSVALARPGAFPVGVLTANLLGCFLMGVAVALAEQRGLSHLSPFVMTGILGGFTTFSAFSLETLTLWERGEPGQAALYVGLSVIGSLAAIALGLWLTRIAA